MDKVLLWPVKIGRVPAGRDNSRHFEPFPVESETPNPAMTIHTKPVANRGHQKPNVDTQ